MYAPANLATYSFAHGNPGRFRDPSGRFVIKIPFTSTYFYAELKRSGGGFIGIGFRSKAELLRSYPKLAGLMPAMREKAERVLVRLEGQGWKPRLAEGLRTPAQQAALVAQGVSQTLNSRHLDQNAKGAAAIDVVDKRFNWNDASKEAQLYFRSYGEAAKKENLIWGGSWGTISPTKGYGWDPAHSELRKQDE